MPSQALPLDRNPAAVYVARYTSLKSRQTMSYALQRLAELIAGPGTDPLAVPWHLLRYQHTQALRSKVAAMHFAPATANLLRIALRGVLKEAWRLGLVGGEESERARDLATIRGSRLPKGRALNQAEILELFEACDRGTVSGARDAALLALLYGAGLRRAEVASATMASYQNGEITIIGKGDKQRAVPLPDGAVAAIRAWLDWRGRDPGPLLYQISKSRGAIVRSPLGVEAIGEILTRLQERAAIAKVTPHDLRRTFVSNLLDAGADISTVQKLAGHESIATTQRYDRRAEASKKKAIKLLHVPFQATKEKV